MRLPDESTILRFRHLLEVRRGLSAGDMDEASFARWIQAHFMQNI